MTRWSASGDGDMARVLSMRLEKLACHFPLKDNYFAWQAFARRYPQPGEAPCPPISKRRTSRRSATMPGACTSITQYRRACWRTKPAGSVDRFVLLDAQDWMSDRQLNELWTEITRTAAPGARVIFRTAAEPTLLPGRLLDDAARPLGLRAKPSRIDFTRRDRSAIYGGFHLYVRSSR